MLPSDKVTFKEQLNPFCIDCGSGDISKDSVQPFWEKNTLIVPLKCKKCGYSFSLNLDVVGEGVV